TVQHAENESLTMHIRVPYWVAGPVTVTVNDDETMTQSKNGYLSIQRTWSTGDRVDIRLPMNLHTYIATDNPTKQALLYGSIVLAGNLSTENYTESDILADHMSLDNHRFIGVAALVTENSDPNQWITR